MRRRARWLLMCTLVAGVALTVGVVWHGSDGGAAASVGRPTRRAADAARIRSALASAQEAVPACANDDGTCLAALRGAVVDKSKQNPKLTWSLAELADAATQARAAGQSITASSADSLPKAVRDMIAARLLRLDSAGRVQVFIETAESPSKVAEALGLSPERVDEGFRIIQAWVPLEQVSTLAAASAVRQVRLPDYGMVQAGSVTTEGDALLKADDVRSAFGVDGSGVRVGVISGGVDGLAVSQASGDLPRRHEHLQCGQRTS